MITLDASGPEISQIFNLLILRGCSKKQEIKISGFSAGAWGRPDGYHRDHPDKNEELPKRQLLFSINK